MEQTEERDCMDIKDAGTSPFTTGKEESSKWKPEPRLDKIKVIERIDEVS